MNEPRVDFKRMLVRLPQSAHDYAAVGVMPPSSPA